MVRCSEAGATVLAAISGLAHDLLCNPLGDCLLCHRNEWFAAPTRPRGGRTMRPGFASCHRMGGDLSFKPSGLLFPRLTNQHPFSFGPRIGSRLSIKAHPIKAHRYISESVVSPTNAALNGLLGHVPKIIRNNNRAISTTTKGVGRAFAIVVRKPQPNHRGRGFLQLVSNFRGFEGQSEISAMLEKRP